MGTVAARLLALVCSLPLGLPQGWCCAATWLCPSACRSAPQSVASDCSPSADCCSCCNVGDTCSKPAPTPTPTPCPKKCTCLQLDRHVTLPVKQAVEQPDAGFVLLVSPLTVAELGVGHQALIVDSVQLAGTPPLHVLLCVWRC